MIQARLNSSRFPKKILKDIGCGCSLQSIAVRLARSIELDGFVFLIPSTKSDDELAAYLEANSLPFIRGSETDVFERYRQATAEYNPDFVVRITADCPFVDPQLVDECVSLIKQGQYDYVSNTLDPTYPDGFDVEVFRADLLDEFQGRAVTSYDREHVTPVIKTSASLLKYNVSLQRDWSHIRVTLDEVVDLQVIRAVQQKFKNSEFGCREVIDLYENNPQLFAPNSVLQRNEGSLMSEGQKLWRRAKSVIPGGNMLLSKRPERFLPDLWPSYYDQAQGCRISTLDGTELWDCSLMGVGTNVLGYGNLRVDNAVRNCVTKGNMTTLNCKEEVLLAERLVSLHSSWAHSVKFARSGGEANAIAARVARATSGKDVIAICGYHGWHDWYLAANTSVESALDEHLLKGLNAKGVPKSLAGTIVTFSYNDLESLRTLLEKNSEIGAVKMEVQRNQPPFDGFLKGVRKLCLDYEIPLIFDECTTGFRETFGGLHLEHEVSPDICVFGKTLGNGYAISAVVMTEDLHKVTEELFISSTFWTERIGFAAALATLDEMEQVRSWEIVKRRGQQIKAIWREVESKYGLDISISGLDSLATFQFNSKYDLQYRTLMAQIFLESGFLAGPAFYASVAHTDEVLAKYHSIFDHFMRTVSLCESGALTIDDLLQSEVIQTGFQRLN